MTKTKRFLERSETTTPFILANRIGEPGLDAEGVGNIDDCTELPGVLPRDGAILADLELSKELVLLLRLMGFINGVIDDDVDAVVVMMGGGGTKDRLFCTGRFF